LFGRQIPDARPDVQLRWGRIMSWRVVTHVLS
jgi:hypothetical protein